MINNLLYIWILCIFSTTCWGETQINSPKFAAVRSSEANLRAGPNVRYPIKWIIVKRYEPVELISEFEKWRKVKDCYGDEGWIHESLLINKRRAVVMGEEDRILRIKPSQDSKAVAIIKPGVRAELLSCKANWCLIKSGKYKGWIEKTMIWGIEKTEVF